MHPTSGYHARAIQLVALAAVFAHPFAESSRRTEAKEPRWAAPPLVHSISVRDTATGERISFEKLIEHIAVADVLFLGESHTDETTHRVQLAIYERLLAQRQSKVVLALEMFQRDVQAVLDRYLAGEIDEADFLEQARPWGHYREAYRPLVEMAKRSGVPVIASNFPTPLLRRVAMAGAEALADAEDPRHVPQQLLPNSAAYWRRVENATRGHSGTFADDDESRLYSIQSLWDNAMGEACADALDEYSGHLVLHINGAFHSDYGDGAAAQLKQRKPDAQVSTIALVPTINPATAELRGRPSADFVIYVEARATNLDQGKRSVVVPREADYQFYLPDAASAESPVPLLIWLPESGLTAEDAMALCRERFGEQTAIAVIEPTYRHQGDDLAPARTWFWPDGFAEDVGTATVAVERTWAYLMRHFPLDAEQVCLAGDGTAATVVTAVATHTDRAALSAVAVQPRAYGRLNDLPLLLPEEYGNDPLPERSLQVIADASQADWWGDELAEYGDVGIDCHFTTSVDDPWQFDQLAVNAVRRGLGISEDAFAEGAIHRYLLVETDAPRARLWARLQAARLARRDGIPTTVVREAPADERAARVSTTITSSAARQPGVLPRCPGPFGGTTVLVVPTDTPRAAVERWLALEENDPLAAESRFHRVRVVTGSAERSLPAVLTKLHNENRTNVLIVPAEFYAGAATMRELQAQTHGLDDQMTLQWLPGLGGQAGILGE